MPSAHDKIIARAAKATLQPLGLRRKGQSRLWIGDHGWWLAIVEFQPSGFSKGSYLNVAAHWLWSDKGYISFDLGSGADWDSRAADFEEYQSDEQFEEAGNRLAVIASEEIRELAARLPSIEATADLLLSHEKSTRGGGSWSTYNAGIAAGLCGRAEEAAAMLRSVTDARVRDAVDRYVSLTSDLTRFRELVLSQIASQREALRLTALRSPPL
ncbi:hypothetical protein [Phenylobacterium sp.]|uniref:hypothetical protein n=1 Tax=Phenylobacterium sp. TaxID=1871053 RepID=UPI002C602F54|nr:hypothetical protein [Phenylobacterium sp.]HVI34475.1 hypothetical protein [Phenylobacterium sp.]